MVKFEFSSDGKMTTNQFNFAMDIGQLCKPVIVLTNDDIDWIAEKVKSTIRFDFGPGDQEIYTNLWTLYESKQAQFDQDFSICEICNTETYFLTKVLNNLDRYLTEFKL